MTTTELNLDLNIVEKRKEKNVKYLKHTLTILPNSVLSLDNSKLLLAYFAISSLDILDRLDKLPHSKQALIDWIYKHQIIEIKNSINNFILNKNSVQTANYY